MAFKVAANHARMPAVALAALIGLTACGVGELDSNTTQALAAQEGRQVGAPGPGPTPIPAPVPTTTPAPNPTPVPTASPTPSPAPSPTPVPPPAASVVNGKALYQNNCQSCHGVDPTRNASNIMRGANSPNAILNAMVRVTNMRYLQPTIKSPEAADIAAYLGNPQ